MDQREAGERNPERRQRFKLLVLALFPLLVATGFLAPGWVSWLAVAQTDDLGPRGPVADRLGPYARRPLVVPRDFSPGTVPALLDMDRLFVGSRLPIEPQVDRGGVPAFDRNFGDVIALDDVGQTAEQLQFPDALLTRRDREILAAVDDAREPLPLCGTLHAGNCVRDDDFASGGVLLPTVIPEPGSGGLVALGLALLAFRRRPSSSR